MAKSNTPSMEDILSSIRNTVQEETTRKVGEEETVDLFDEESGTSDVEQPEQDAQGTAVPAEEDVLELSSDDLLEEGEEGADAPTDESVTKPAEEPEEEFVSVSTGLTADASAPAASPDTMVDLEAFSQKGHQSSIPEKAPVKTAEAAPEEEAAPAEPNAGTTDEPTGEEAEKAKLDLDPDKSDEEVAAEIDALLAEVQKEDKKKAFPEMKGPAARASDKSEEDLLAEVMDETDETEGTDDDENLSVTVTPEEEAAAAAEEPLENVDQLMNETDKTVVESPSNPPEDANQNKDDMVNDLLEQVAPAATEAAPAEDEAPAADSAAEEPVDVDALMAEAAPEAAPAEETPATEESPVPAEPAAAEEPVDVDALMAEAAPDAAPAEETPATEESPAPAEPAPAEEASAEPAAEAPTEEPAAPTEEPEPAPAPKEAPKPAPGAASHRVNLAATPSPSGLQVAFPAEVLAEALRPLVHDWVVENLPDLVERLVREELSKLAEE